MRFRSSTVANHTNTSALTILVSDTWRGRSRGGACRRRHQFWAAKGAKFHREIPPFVCLFQNKVGCPPCPYKKFQRKTSSQFWDIRQNIFDPVCPIVKFQQKRILTSGVVLLCWILLHKTQMHYIHVDKVKNAIGKLQRMSGTSHADATPDTCRVTGRKWNNTRDRKRHTTSRG